MTSQVLIARAVGRIVPSRERKRHNRLAAFRMGSRGRGNHPAPGRRWPASSPKRRNVAILRQVIRREVVTMQSQTTYTRAKTLGPFLTLILLASPERGRTASEALQSASVGSSTSSYTPFATREETFYGGKPAARTLGPLLTLILTVGRSRPDDLLELAVRV